MKKFYEKPYFYFWITSVVILIIGYIPFIYIGDSVLDINVHDTYFVISNRHISILLATYYFLIGLLYWFFKFIKIPLLTILTKVHFLISIGIIPVYFIGHYFLDSFNKSKYPLFDDTSQLMIFLTVLAIVFILAQILFILNLIIGLLKHFFNRNKA